MNRRYAAWLAAAGLAAALAGCAKKEEPTVVTGPGRTIVQQPAAPAAPNNTIVVAPGSQAGPPGPPGPAGKAGPAGQAGPAGKPGPAGQVGSAAAPATSNKPASSGNATALADLKSKISSLRSYAMKVEMPGLPGADNITTQVKLEKGKPVKMRMAMPGGAGNMIIDVPAHTMYMLDPTAKTIHKSQWDPAATGGMPSTVEESFDQIFGANPTVTSDTLNGKPAWKAVIGSGDSAATTWFDKASGLPLRTTSEGKSVNMTYSQINAVADSMFVVPKDYKVVELQLPPMGGGTTTGR